MYIMKLKPALKDNIWGGAKLKNDYNFKTDLKIIAEAWTLSCHKDGENIIENGEFKGSSFTDYINAHKTVLGKKAEKYDDFPILIKLIDAKNDLSIQVHPNDEYAKKYENEFGKTEMWYVVDAEKDAKLIYGFKEKISKEDFKNAIENNTLLDVLNIVNVKPGDVFFIEAGTVHAIGKGVFIAEIQQNSNSTYRVYDYNRLGNDGKPRELHIQKALDTAVTEPPKSKTTAESQPEKIENATKQLLKQCDLFTVYSYEIDGKINLFADENSFINILVIDGNGKIDDMEFKKGDSFFIPSSFGNFEIDAKAKLLVTSL